MVDANTPINWTFPWAGADVLPVGKPAEIVIAFDEDDTVEWVIHLHLPDGGRIRLGSGYPNADEAQATAVMIRQAIEGAPIRTEEAP